MDVKGIAWVGRLYEKFETMCLEVEDIICQDTAKYVENQVEVVGASVKRFYSDVMQDLLPQSELSDEKVAVCNSALDNYENVVICKKPMVGMKIERSKSTENSRGTADTIRDIVHQLPRGPNRANNPDSVSSPHSATRAQIDVCSREKDDDNIHLMLDLDGRDSTTKGCNSEKKYANDASSCCAISNRKSEASSELAGNMETTMSVKGTRFNSAMQSSNETETKSDDLLYDVSSNFIVDAEETRLLSCGDSSAELDARSHSWSLDELELEHVTHNIQPADETNLDEEACVLVNGDDVHFDSNEQLKHKHYKKITGAFSFTKKSKRKQEYKELAVKHGYGFTTIPNQQHEQKLPAGDISEHDWQLL
ncbi:hypothetical protein SDJN02_27186 [Cucurbita argyrosperma subsp. argyrosperma]|nr:hypothetical protein SDJN02_27186 [Cucurbita argyrosperma subsp. argyrosperma]